MHVFSQTERISVHITMLDISFCARDVKILLQIYGKQCSRSISTFLMAQSIPDTHLNKKKNFAGAALALGRINSAISLYLEKNYQTNKKGNHLHQI